MVTDDEDADDTVEDFGEEIGFCGGVCEPVSAAFDTSPDEVVNAEGKGSVTSDENEDSLFGAGRVSRWG